MRYLLDSHALLWFSEDSPELSEHAKALLLDSANEILVSMASFWEISIKSSLGKLRLEGGYEALLEVTQKNGFEILDLKFNHTTIVNKLPFHHRDPFDRMIIAQAIAENIDIIGTDKAFDNYLTGTTIKRIW